MLVEKISDGFVSLGLAVFAGIAWLLRLEAKSNKSVEDIDRIERRMDNYELNHAKILDDLGDIREMTAQIKGYLSMPDRNKN